MRKISRRILAIILVACLGIMSSRVAFAQDENFQIKDSIRTKLRENVTADEFKQVKEEYSVINSHVTFLDKCIQNIEKNDEEVWEFEVEIEGIVNKISLFEQSDNKTSILFIQDDIVNQLDIYKNGDIILDGNYVQNNMIEPKVSTSWWQASSPYGSASDYTVSAGTQSNPNVSLGGAIESIAVGLFYYLLTPVIGGAASVIYSSLYTIVKSQDPRTTGLSYRANKYFHKNQRSAGYIPAVGLYVTKYNYTWYSKTNYNGSISYQTAFYVNQPG